MPFDNIKTRMQSLGSTKSVGMFRLALSMLKTEGPLVFWRATTPRLMRLTVSERFPPPKDLETNTLQDVERNHLHCLQSDRHIRGPIEGAAMDFKNQGRGLNIHVSSSVVERKPG